MKNWHRAGKLHNIGLHKALFVRIPFGTFKRQTSDECSVFDNFCNIRNGLLSRNEVKFKLVN